MNSSAAPDRASYDRSQTTIAAGIPATPMLGVPVSLVNMSSAVATIVGWAQSGVSNFVCIRDVHGVMRAQDDPTLLDIHRRAGMVTPDGMPLVWVSRRRGHKNVDRVCGADLVAALCEASVEQGLRHYFHGGKPGVADRMATALSARFPGLIVAGTRSPPFGDLTPEEDRAETATIVAARPHIVWVGFSTPKQEYWMSEHFGRIPGAVLIGVGAAFDFYAGDVKRAPKWMQHSGLEWLHRLISEPRRLWRRYLVLGPKFVFAIIRSELRSRQG